MASKIFVLVALLALSVSAANAYLIPQWSPAAIASIIPSNLQQLNPLGFEQQAVQSYRLQQALAASTIPSSSMILQQPWALQQQQSSAHLAVQSVAAVQHQQPAYSQLAVANPAAYFQQQQLLPFNQLSDPVAYLQQQQLLPFNQIAVANPSAFWQQQQLNTQAVANAAVAAALFQQKQPYPYNQLAVTMNPAAIFQGPLVGGAIF
ncbi:hypothetical protein BS78_05G208500 [Paspalum vaginatum]|uniref:Uncharacterized protein n=1 Tax=Paspalum vaginatum TaxID=158149 RepID=A0A9W8CDD2_9POAL|nr:hypothetical protein BS78_K024400 [Paspalum vaginatum]KAJ1254599.1 hypothetical protein BS78_K024500 [Paspalum vaginatum]KAJ1254600.1 hypothetical protein BS78_K024600 [Paspalum vaginatum]KAJ1254602.1 hypothetical protein BS78_K024800 [Paspalum vaginatum]KAJ1254603.1 hypothetical protein BS78_K024900 [Paspalum vaginatum]